MNIKKYFENRIDNSVGGKLSGILEYKIKELVESKKSLPIEKILRDLSVQQNNFALKSLKKSLLLAEPIGLLAEIKLASPSNQDINLQVDIEKQAIEYEKSGADAISVLTDKKFFKGDLAYLSQIKNLVKIPVIRKDFIFDPYQVYESKFYGADAILLIATILKTDCLNELIELAHDLKMECLVEIHTSEDLEKVLNTNANIIGINARDLQTFEINLQRVIDLVPFLPIDKILVAESGIRNREDVKNLKRNGIKNILVGTTLMKVVNISEKIKELKLI